MISLLQYLVCFLIFSVLQAMFINGVKNCFEEGMIFYGLRIWIDEIFGDFFNKAIYKCIRCMSSVYGTLTFWGFVIPIFGFYKAEIPIYIADVFILVYLNYFLYKRQ